MIFFIYLLISSYAENNTVDPYVFMRLCQSDSMLKISKEINKYMVKKFSQKREDAGEEEKIFVRKLIERKSRCTEKEEAEKKENKLVPINK